MVKSVLEAISVYWMYFWIPVCVIEKIRKTCFKFFWSSFSNKKIMAWVKWHSLDLPKKHGGRGFKIPALFSNALAAKSVWNLIASDGLWVRIVTIKYIYPLSALYWIRKENKSRSTISLCW